MFEQLYSITNPVHTDCRTIHDPRRSTYNCLTSSKSKTYHEKITLCTYTSLPNSRDTPHDLRNNIYLCNIYFLCFQSSLTKCSTIQKIVCNI